MSKSKIVFAEPGPTAQAPLALFYAPPSDLPVRLATPSAPPAPGAAPGSSGNRPRTMQRAIMRPVDLTGSHGFNLVRENLVRMCETYNPAYEAAGINFDHEWGGPSHGWCSRVYMGDGDLLWTDWNQLSDEAVDGMLSGQWPRCSAEFWLSHPVLKDWYFTGLALLGSKGPAVPGLPAPVLMQRQIYRLIQLEADSSAGSTTETTRSESTEPTAPVSGEPKEDDMSKQNSTPSGAGAATPENPPAAEPSTAATAAPAAAGPDNAALAAQSAQLAATTSQVNATLAKAEATLAAANATLANARRKEAELDVDKRLDALGKRVTPGMRKLARGLLVELCAAADAVAVKLSAGDGKPAVDTPVAEQIFALLAACPDHSANFGAIAGVETDPSPVTLSEVDQRSGITADRAAELARKYPGSFATN